MPNTMDINHITLFALLDYFNQSFIAKNFIINIGKYTHLSNNTKIILHLKLNNFAHLVGIRSILTMPNNTISKKIPKTFLDGILYQWILINNYEPYKIDIEKLEVFSWMKQTLSNPTYILTEDAIRKENTKFKADLIFIRQISNSNKYAFHIVGLKYENSNIYTIVSQFAIKLNRYKRIEVLFNLKKAFYIFNTNTKKIPR